MTYVDVQNMTVEVDLSDAWRDADPWERANLVEAGRDEIVLLLGGEVPALLEDPAKRLEVITWLRSNGWSVEPC